MKIIAVVVTYNRIKLLERVLASLKAQSNQLDDILVINNGSTDGTSEWLACYSGVTVINQENVGGSGGFYRGIQEAYRRDADWVWCMDDDVFPTVNCLEQLLAKADSDTGILVPCREMNGRPFLTEQKRLNLSNPFKKLHVEDVAEQDLKNNVVSIEAMTFEGPLIKRDVVEKIGLPTKDLFILYDDTDYSYRTVLAGKKVLLVPSAKLEKYYFNVNLTPEERVIRDKWKLWYQIRNTAWFCKTYGKNFWYRNFASLGMFVHIFLAMLKNIPFNNKYSMADVPMLFKMFRRGTSGKLGKIEWKSR